MSIFLRFIPVVLAINFLSSISAVDKEQDQSKPVTNPPKLKYTSLESQENIRNMEPYFFCQPQSFIINISYNTNVPSDYFPIKVFFKTYSDDPHIRSILIDMHSAKLPDNLQEKYNNIDMYNYMGIKEENHENTDLPSNWYLPSKTYKIIDMRGCYEKEWINLLNADMPAFTLEKLEEKSSEVIHSFPVAGIFQLNEPARLKYFIEFESNNGKFWLKGLKWRDKNNYKLNVDSFIED